ncbi:zinc finger, CCHC-type containing protein [Tanacetum coccineum]
MHFLLTTFKVVYVLTTPILELVEDATVEAIRIRTKWENDDYICRGHILNGMSDSLFDVYTNVKSAKELRDSLESKYMVEDASSKKFLKDFKHTLKQGKDDLSLVQLVCHLRIEKSLRAQESDKGKGKEVGRPSINMIEEGKNKHNKQNKGKKQSNENNNGSSSNKKPKLECWKCGKTCHFKRDCRSAKKNNTNVGGSGKGSKDQSKDQGFECYNNGMFMLNLNNVPDDSYSVYMSSSTVVNSLLWHARLGHKNYKRMLEMSKDDLIPSVLENLKKMYYLFCYVFLLHAKDEALDKFRIYKTEVELQQDDLIKTLCTDRGGEYYDPIFFQSIGIIHETITPYTPQQNGVDKRKNRALKEMVNSILSYSGLSEGFWEEDLTTYDEAMQSRYADFWKEAIDDEIGSNMENNTWVLSDLSPGCKPLD